MECNCQDHGQLVRNKGQNGKAMQIKVHLPLLRYHNHLDESIVATEWTKQEEETLF